MLSKPYQSRNTAKKDAKSYAQQHGLTKFILIVDIEKKLYYFSDQVQAPKPKMIVFGRYALVKSEWKDKTPLAKVICSGGVVKTKRYLL